MDDLGDHVQPFQMQPGEDFERVVGRFINIDPTIQCGNGNLMAVVMIRGDKLEPGYRPTNTIQDSR